MPENHYLRAAMKARAAVAKLIGHVNAAHRACEGVNAILSR